MMQKNIKYTIYAITMILSSSSNSHSTDWYDICYKQVESAYGEFTDINWMKKVWACTEAHQMEDLGLNSSKQQANSAAKIKSRQCDFDKPVGGCSGKITITGSSGSKSSYSADIRVTASSGACSKVEFFVGSSAYTSVLRLDGFEDESLFGTSPITYRDIQVKKCTSFARKAD